MILQLSPFFSIVVLSLALRCKEVVNGFHCKRNTESIPFPQSDLEQCQSNDGQVVCMHSFKFGGDVFELSKVVPHTTKNSLKQCETLTSEYLVFCDKNDCEVDAITASKRCNLTNVLKCGGKVHKIEDSNDTFDACTIVFKRPSIASNIIDEWHRDKNESGKMAKTNNDEDCGWNEDRSYVKIFCYEDGCDERSDGKVLRDTYKEQTIICNDIGYIVNSQDLECPEFQKVAACAVTIQIVNGSITRSSSFSIVSSSEPGNYCSSVNSTSQSFVSVCYSDNCDRSPEEIHAKNCNVTLFQCWETYHFFYKITPKENPFCVFTRVKKENNLIFNAQFKQLEKPSKSFCDRQKNEFYCAKNCEIDTVNVSLAQCLYEREKAEGIQGDEDTPENRSRSRLIINITMVVIFLLIATVVFSGGLIALRNAQRAIAYEKEKYRAEFGVSFGESEPEDPPIEVKKEERRRKREGATKTGGRSVTGQTAVKTKTTTKRSTPDV
ncbi:hypothetical protein PRIPAC_70598 [Pristionchus pacificus]|uniref:Uncharacterized protein n=1 Tax=Pristionchus pacificus TaxID=54126 RepID=A0A2A6CR25_PRIPA|nr:hypothetical protein PRIPAC_70598 [Pristionchus pacificus]|eukprot:PDM80665.1 hypothetical protein PRIPAC_35668 [Pristionchus pacificus]